MKIAICRLRQGVHYERPLTTILDSFYECLRAFIRANPQHDYSYFKFSFANFDTARKPTNLKALELADVVIIPSEAEFTYWVPGKLHSLSVNASNQQVRRIGKAIAGKRVILLRSDRADSIELYRTRTFQNRSIDYRIVDEDDFPFGIHGMKYHFIKDRFSDLHAKTRIIDFAYWGSDKSKLPDGKRSGDMRHAVLRELQESELATCFWGRVRGIDPYQKWEKKFENLAPWLWMVKSTLCFNWIDPKAITARYAESLACGVMPFVWENYDASNKVVWDDWQRIYDSSEIGEKLSEKSFQTRFRTIRREYERRLPSISDYKKMFSNKLDALL